MKQEQSKYRIVAHNNDSDEHAYYIVEERRYFLGIKRLGWDYWEKICFHKVYDNDGWIRYTYAFHSYDDAKDALEKYRNSTSVPETKIVYEE